MKSINKIFAIVLAVMMLFSCSIQALADNQYDLTDATITFNDGTFDGTYNTYNYTGLEIEPSITVSKYATELTKNQDYTVTYSNNENAGIATLTVTGAGSYTGSVSKEYKILPANIVTLTANGDIKLSATLVTPKTNTVVYAIKADGTALVKGVDFNSSITNTSKCGIGVAKLTVTGIGNYTGTKTYKLNVNPDMVTGLKFSSRTNTSIKLTWDSQASSGVTGYKVYTTDKNGANAKLYKTVSTNECTVTGLTAGKNVYFQVKAYYYDSASKRTLYSVLDANAENVTKPSTVTVKSVANSGKDKLKVTWTKATGNGYQIQYGTKSDMSNAKSIYVSSSATVTKTITVPKNSTKYFVRVRAYKNFNGAKIYGNWSSKLTNKFSVLYSTYTSNYVNNKNRTTNLQLASKAINGTILQPGATFSFNKVVGQRTAARGYKPAHIFVGATASTEGIGGGVCQVASTMFNAALLGNFKIAERHQHSQRVAYVPLGRDAAIYWGSMDFKFTNNTSSAMQIRMTCKNGKITCSIYTCEDIKPKKVSLKVNRSGNNFTLKRTVAGKVNYTAKSRY